MITVNKGGIIYTDGDLANEIYFIIEGTVEVINKNEI